MSSTTAVTEPVEDVPTGPKKTQRITSGVARVGVAAVAFAILATVFGGIFAVATPPFWGHDEITQFGRAYQVAHGGILPLKIKDDRGVAYGGTVPQTIDSVMGYAMRDYVNNPQEPAPMVASEKHYDQLLDKPLTENHHVVWFTNTAAYSPVPYIPAAIGIRVATVLNLDVGNLLLLTRLAGLVAYVGVVFFGLRALRDSRVQWLAFTVALLPIAVFQAGTITADTLTNALAIMVSALLVKALFLGKDLSRPESAALLASAIVLPLCKPTYVLLAMLVVVVPIARYGLPARFRLVPWAFAGVGGVLFLIWTKISSPTTAGMGLMRKPSQWHSVVPGDQLRGILTNPIGFIDVFGDSVMRRDQEWFTEFFGELGFAYINVPATSIVACLLALAIAVGTAEQMVATHRRTAIVAVVIAATVAMIYVTLYLSFSPVDFYIIDGVQGRYFVPLAILFFAALLRWMPLRLQAPTGQLNMRGPAIAIVVATLISLLCAVWKYNVVVYG
ncbi:DUF2142 domain-containing protein [Antrihabitans sp. YC2-6]|uniref:DUF2142 domain-containing protein n=1 Tax=Antrihabitans sp. YC2-6 TaxID=2799498 RepID=UPI0018F571B3|nr:DUF2142 domain-containing protein [Antrihabitans sp. YC2-6]MBJ8346207.1 DUF2142 domain-containing protein [Antrihabitans sp. YC2-6]